MLHYGLRNLKRAPNGDDEIDGWLVLVHGTVKYLAGLFKVDKTTVQCTYMEPRARIL